MPGSTPASAALDRSGLRLTSVMTLTATQIQVASNDLQDREKDERVSRTPRTTSGATDAVRGGVGTAMVRLDVERRGEGEATVG